MLLSLFSPQYGLFWAICPFPIIKYIHTYIHTISRSSNPYRDMCGADLNRFECVHRMETNGIGLHDFSLYDIWLWWMVFEIFIVAKAIELNLNFCLHQVNSGFRQRLPSSTRILYHLDPTHLSKCEKTERVVFRDSCLSSPHLGGATRHFWG